MNANPAIKLFRAITAIVSVLLIFYFMELLDVGTFLSGMSGKFVLAGLFK